MQLFVTRPDTPGYTDPVQAYLSDSYHQRSRSMVKRCINLLSAGIARAPAYEGNWMLGSLFRQDGPAFASQHIAEAVEAWLRLGRRMPVALTGLSRHQLREKRGAHWVYETYTQATLLDWAWRKQRPLMPILVEGSPDAPYWKTIRNLSAVRRTHHFVLLQFGGRLYAIDGARGMVFDSLAAYLDTVILSGHWGESSVRMKHFRIFAGGRENDPSRGFAAEDSWETSVH
jgi:hypothetical protein